MDERAGGHRTGAAPDARRVGGLPLAAAAAASGARFLHVVQDLIFHSPSRVFTATAVAIACVKCGVGVIPNYGLSLRMANDPFVNPLVDPNAHYLFWNWLGPFVAWLVGARSAPSFTLLHLGFSLTFTALFVGFAFRRLSDRAARTAILIFLALPASSTIYYWVGMDSLTLLLILVALLAFERPVVVAAAGVALGMQHFEQGLVVAGSLGAFHAIDRLLGTHAVAAPRRPLAACAALGAGVCVGKAVLAVIFREHGIVVYSRIYLFGNEHRTLLAQFRDHWPVIVWSVLGVAWLVVPRYALRGRRSIPFLVVLGGLLALLPFVQDQTRALAIVGFPLLAVCWLFDEAFLAGISEREAAGFFLVWILVPWTWVWMGIPRASAFPDDVRQLLRVAAAVL